MLRDLLAAERGWIKATPREEVRNAISIVAERLCDNDAGGPRRDLPAPGREALRDALERVLASPADRETKTAARRVLAEWGNR